MITEDYVSFEVAKLLKEKGFVIPCDWLYCSDGSFGHRNSLWDKEMFPAPTLQMAMKWLREVHNLFIQITVDFSDGAYPIYDVCIVNLAICTSIVVNGYNRYSYKEAVETALKYSLESLENLILL